MIHCNNIFLLSHRMNQLQILFSLILRMVVMVEKVVRVVEADELANEFHFYSHVYVACTNIAYVYLIRS